MWQIVEMLRLGNENILQNNPHLRHTVCCVRPSLRPLFETNRFSRSSYKATLPVKHIVNRRWSECKFTSALGFVSVCIASETICTFALITEVKIWRMNVCFVSRLQKQRQSKAKGHDVKNQDKISILKTLKRVFSCFLFFFNAKTDLRGLWKSP